VFDLRIVDAHTCGKMTLSEIEHWIGIAGERVKRRKRN
jgi:hypothetical protein